MKAVKTPVAEAIDTQSKVDQFEALFGFTEESQEIAPRTWQHKLCKIVVWAVALVTGATAAMTVAVAVYTAALSFTGLVFLATVLYLVTWILGFVSALLAADEIASYICDGGATRHIKQAGGWVRGLFGKSEASAPEELNADYSAVKQSIKRKVTRVRDAKDEMISRMRKGVSHV